MNDILQTRPKTATISHVTYATSYRFFVTFSDRKEDHRQDVSFDPYYAGSTYDEAYKGITDAISQLGYKLVS